MTELSPPPDYQPGYLARIGGLFLPGVRQVVGDIPVHASTWHDQNADAVRGTKPIWVALGDSTAQGVGADDPFDGYVGQLAGRLQERGEDYGIVNLSVAGAVIGDVLGDQLDRLAELDVAPALLTCTVGTNDAMSTPNLVRLRRELTTLIETLGDFACPVVFATLPQVRSSMIARSLNVLVHEIAPVHGVLVADVASNLAEIAAESTDRAADRRRHLAVDRFHPSATGYVAWADAFDIALGG